jgi:Peptidase family M23
MTTTRARSHFSLRRPLLAGVAALLLVAPGAADAAGPRPLFQMPVPCGQTWEASTYAAHWNGNQNAIDLAQREDDGTNISEGEPALASADGTVKQVYTTSKGEHRVQLDHGAGWTTHYVHLESLPPLTVGQHVAQGEQIGRISNSGAASMHLHYNQEADGAPVAVEFNGQAIQTNAENEETWNTYGNGEELTSLNCPGNSFMQFSQDGKRHQLEYRPGDGKVSIDRFVSNGAGLTNRWTGSWSKGWTHFVPFNHDDEPRFFAYKSSSGKVSFNKVKANGQGNQQLSSGTWGKGWTHFMPFSKSGSNYYIAYSSLYGGANLDRITAAGTGGATIWQGNWGKGWTHLAPFDLDGVQYFLAYHGGTGAVEIDKVTGSGNSLTITEDWSSTWSTGWTHIVPIGHNGHVHLLRYKAGSGTASYGRIKAGGEGLDTLGSETWSKPWTAFSPFTLDGKGHFIAYKAGSGQAVIDRLSASGADSSGIWSDLWTLGWT